MSRISRRHLIAGGTALAATTTLAACSNADQDPVRPKGVPLGPYGAESTAEQVVEGIDLRGMTALVTGANSGLGFETMRVLASRGAHVLCVARTSEKAEAACAKIQGQTTPVVIELTDFPSIVAGTDAVRAMGLPIDMLILNAGIMALPHLEQVYGLEKQFVTNHLGHFIVGNRLMPQVRAAAQGRVVVLTSLGYKWAPKAGIEFDNLSGERNYDPDKMYGQSKLANHLYVRQLAKIMAGTPVTANSVHPGIVMTNLGRSFPEWKKALGKLIGWTFMKSIEAGAATTCYVATAPALAHVSGYYFADCNPEVPGGQMQNDALAARLWQVSEELTRPYLL
ncbi:MAG: SDR family NAD(P)-dependent oxidoreductase [Gammaproteobacteria bacterium PRO9]|nr:SDR family NAD(P)-dependent oxidoreductase [Gammaproteobacteria bacterium PRO9]